MRCAVETICKNNIMQLQLTIESLGKKIFLNFIYVNIDVE